MMNHGQTNSARAERGAMVVNAYGGTMTDLICDLLAYQDAQGGHLDNCLEIARRRLADNKAMGDDPNEAANRYTERVRLLPADLFTRNATPGRCDCGADPIARVPVDKTVADVYGYELEGGAETYIDVCGPCYSDMYQTGHLAHVLGRDVALTSRVLPERDAR